ncbi:hypothetical protein CALCODRAFT_487054 [Calocera cornea HHB12733]|uniref:Galactose oxidase n=1 Tax=Calocera cornea HHB12733 TaxID=1353952 RepID=A0A165DD04_9BASI|nr:hypothetical protein CALCODRAFT_487054 [Calocera cornea HHB12733]
MTSVTNRYTPTALDLNTLGTATVSKWECLWSSSASSMRGWRTLGDKGDRLRGRDTAIREGVAYIFGGTDGTDHYNDVWAFDVRARRWTEVQAFESPRDFEACRVHAPSERGTRILVDDVMYIFGGRGVDGQDLNDLAAFNVSMPR